MNFKALLSKIAPNNDYHMKYTPLADFNANKHKKKYEPLCIKCKGTKVIA